MMRFAYTNSEGGVCIVIGAPKESIEQSLAIADPIAGATPLEALTHRVETKQLTDEEYEQIIRDTIPSDATNITKLSDDWVAPNRATRAQWRLRDGKIVVEQ